MALFTDGVTSAIEQALNGVSLRQKVAANNIANSETPGFHAGKVDFESALASAISAGNPAGATPSVVDAGTPANGQGNTVQLENETTTLVKSGLQYDSLVAALNYKLGLLRTAIEGHG